MRRIDADPSRHSPEIRPPTHPSESRESDNRLVSESRDRLTPDQSGSGSGSVAGAVGTNNLEYEKRLRQLRWGTYTIYVRHIVL